MTNKIEKIPSDEVASLYIESLDQQPQLHSVTKLLPPVLRDELHADFTVWWSGFASCHPRNTFAGGFENEVFKQVWADYGPKVIS